MFLGCETLIVDRLILPPTKLKLSFESVSLESVIEMSVDIEDRVESEESEVSHIFSSNSKRVSASTFFVDGSLKFMMLFKSHN